MTDGFYKVHYETGLGQGFGVATLTDGKIRGGDGAFYYTGTFTLKGDEFAADVVTGRFGDPKTPSVFGKDDVHLTLQGNVTKTSISVKGHAKEAPDVAFHATFTKIAD
jgi:hypothetical protein